MFGFFKPKATKKSMGRAQRVRLEVENLEDRLVQSVTAGPVMTPDIAAAPQYIPAITPYTAIELRHAYGFDNLPLGPSGTQLTGAGQTIAIVVAFDVFDEFQNGDLRHPLPNMQADLHTFDQDNHLPDVQIKPVFSVLPAIEPPSGPWGLEASLDVEWAHAIAPGANIDLVEAQSDSLPDLMNAVDLARQQPGVTVVSMSWSGMETANETQFDSILTTFPGHVPTTFVTGSGDHGTFAYDNNGNEISTFAVQYPAASPNVVSVGGTHLNLELTSTGSAYVSESAWSAEQINQTFTDPNTGQNVTKTILWSSGGGISQFESQPSFQTGFLRSVHRTIPDVAYNGDIFTGVEVFRSDQPGGGFTGSGTSAGTPQWAALFALANQGRAVHGLTSLNHALQDIYTQSCNDFNDITTGNNGTFSATTGYDLVTGRGTPIANLLIPDLINVEQPPPPPVHHPLPGIVSIVSSSWSTSTVSLAATPAIVVQGPRPNTGGMTTLDVPGVVQAGTPSKPGLVTFNVETGRDGSLFEPSALWVFPGHVLRSCI